MTTSGDALISCASLDGVSFDVPVSRGVLLEYLRRFEGFTLADVGEGDSDLHRITCELWTVTDGRPMPGGIDHHDLVAGWAGLVTGMASAGLVAGLRWLERAEVDGSARGSSARRRPAPGDYARAATMVVEQARRTSQRTALGPYHEMLIGIPDVCIESETTRYTAVLGMISDSAVACAIDGWFGYGYHKHMGRFVFHENGSVEVRQGDQLVLVARFGIDEQQCSPSTVGYADRVNRYWEQPLLGGLHEGELRWSSLHRRADATTPCAPIRGDVTIAWPDLIEPSTAPRLIENDGPRALTAVMFKNVDARISRPLRVARS